MSETTTVVPACPSRIAIPRPRPLAAPVTKAIFPVIGGANFNVSPAANLLQMFAHINTSAQSTHIRWITLAYGLPAESGRPESFREGRYSSPLASWIPSTVQLDLQAPLGQFGGKRPQAPSWYEKMLEISPEHFSVPVAGATIEVLAWGELGRPGLLLVHGAWAHARWWTAVAPILSKHYRVAALSLSGMGGSDWRPSYSSEQHMEELFSASRCAGLFEAAGTRPILAAHSFGAQVAILAAAERGNELSGTILIDIGTNRLEPSQQRTRKPPRRQASMVQILERFRLAPPEPCDEPAVLYDVALAGVTELGGVWSWRFDPDFWAKQVYKDCWRALAVPLCPLAMIHGQYSRVATPEKLADQKQQMPAGTPFIEIPQAHHHIMLDKPVALAAAIHSVIECWRAAAP